LIFSLDGEFGVSLGVLGFSFSTDFENNTGLFYGRFFNFMYELGNGIGFTASPLNFWMDFEDTNNSIVTFMNISVFYNFFKNDKEHLMLGPFASLHALGYNNPGFIEFRTGLGFSLRNINIYFSDHDVPIYENTILNSDFFIFECGFKYNKMDGHRYYFHVGVDLLAAIIFISGNEKRAFDDYQRERM